MNGEGPGAISQAFDTVPDALYLVLFDMAGNPDDPIEPDPDLKVLVVSANSETEEYVFGWKSTTYELRWEDDACKYDGTNWTPLVYPFGHYYYKFSLDLAFVITGTKEEPPEIIVDIIHPRDGLYIFGRKLPFMEIMRRYANADN